MTDYLHYHDEEFDAQFDHREADDDELFYEDEEEVFVDNDMADEIWDDGWDDIELNMDNEYYNDNLDMDQQSQAFWDNI